MNRYRSLLYAVTLFTTSASSLLAGEMVFQNGSGGYQGAYDATLLGQTEAQQNRNYGHAKTLEVAGVAHGGMKRLGLIAFTGLTGPNALPAGVKIKQATLKLYKIGEPRDDGQYAKVAPHHLDIRAVRLLTPWVAGTQEGKPEEGSVTFAYRAYEHEVPQFWGNANQMESGPVKGVDFEETGAASCRLIPGLESDWMEWDLTSLVQQWVADPSSNHGILLSARSYYVGSYFASCEANEQEFRPKLEILY